jgi:hypothetical protein
MVDHVRSSWRVSIRRACRALPVERSAYHYRSRRAGQAQLTERIKEIAATRVRYGYRRIHVLLCREGWRVNGHLPERSIMTGIGAVEVCVPRVRDRLGGADDRIRRIFRPALSKGRPGHRGLVSQSQTSGTAGNITTIGLYSAVARTTRFVFIRNNTPQRELA